MFWNCTLTIVFRNKIDFYFQQNQLDIWKLQFTLGKPNWQILAETQQQRRCIKQTADNSKMYEIC